MNPILYVLMRTDLDSLNSGKAMAQSVHVGNAIETHFEDEMHKARLNNELDYGNPTAKTRLHDSYWEWKRQTSQGFGTTIVLGGSMSRIKTDIECLQKLGFLAAVVHNPTYPLLDGKVTHLIPLDTCAYVFAPDKDDDFLRVVLNKYELHP